MAHLVTLANGDVVDSTDNSDSIDRLCVALAQCERARAACRRRMQSAIAESVDCRAQLKAGQVESSTFKASAYRNTMGIESLKKSIFTLETETAHVSLSEQNTPYRLIK